MRFGKILVPVDGSEHSRKAAETAVDLALLSRGGMVVLNCRRPLPRSLGEPNLSLVLAQQAERAEEVLSALRSLWSGKGLEVEEKVVGGPAAETITEVAEAEKADLIVMGSKGKSDLQGLILGSVTHKVLHMAPCPVLVVKA